MQYLIAHGAFACWGVGIVDLLAISMRGWVKGLHCLKQLGLDWIDLHDCVIDRPSLWGVDRDQDLSGKSSHARLLGKREISSCMKRITSIIYCTDL